MAKKKREEDCQDETEVVSPKVIQKIKDSGFRLTQARLKILQVFATHAKAFSPTELFSLLNEKFKKEHFDRVTVYRIIEAFEELEIIHPVGNGKYVYCAHQNCAHDEHFILICNNCGKVQELGVQSKSFTALGDLLQKEAQFQLSGESIVLRGLCSQCA